MRKITAGRLPLEVMREERDGHSTGQLSGFCRVLPAPGWPGLLARPGASGIAGFREVALGASAG